MSGQLLAMQPWCKAGFFNDVMQLDDESCLYNNEVILDIANGNNLKLLPRYIDIETIIGAINVGSQSNRVLYNRTFGAYNYNKQVYNE